MDLQFIQFSDALELTGAEEVPDLTPRSLLLHGIDMRSAVEVYVNDQLSPSFVIASKNRIIAQVPSTQTKALIRTIEILSSEFTATVRSKILFRIGTDSKKITGLKALMQTFLKLLFTTAGTDSFSKRLGGSALKAIGDNFDVAPGSNIVANFTIAVGRTAEQMISLQSYQPRLSDDERLLTANLLNVRFDPALTALVARIELIPQSGIRAIVNLEL